MEMLIRFRLWILYWDRKLVKGISVSMGLILIFMELWNLFKRKWWWIEFLLLFKEYRALFRKLLFWLGVELQLLRLLLHCSLWRWKFWFGTEIKTIWANLWNRINSIWIFKGLRALKKFRSIWMRNRKI